MRTTEFHLSTLKEDPADAELASHRLMLRAGLIRRLASGLYTWLPLGVRVLRKVETIVREEMNTAGALEVLMPVVQPAELWQESGRWDKYGKELLRLQDRHDREFCLGPTHEEVITDLARNEIRSYKQLPLNFYQIQTKFRDEIRPRFGLMRAREFCMKDAYSFHIDEESLQETYASMHRSYCKIFDRLGLNYRPVLADTGSIGGEGSHEFHVLAESGEDLIAYSDGSDYAANVEKAETLIPALARTDANAAMTEVATPGQHSIEDVAAFLQIPAAQTVKTLLVKASEESEHELLALVVRGDHQLNAIKAAKLNDVAAPLEFASEASIRKLAGSGPGSLGPVNLPCPVIVDHAAFALNEFVCGANSDDKHLQGCHWDRDCTVTEVCDLRNVCEGEPSPDGNGVLRFARGIEVGHIFQLGRNYSDAMQANVLDENGKQRTMVMGCYGIGVSRIVAAAVEQNHDDNGIIWPASLAPFTLAIVPLNAHKSETVRAAGESLYKELSTRGVDVLLDDRKERPGVKFAELELIGVPHRVVIGDRSLEKGEIEYKNRVTGAENSLTVADAADQILAILAQG